MPHHVHRRTLVTALALATLASAGLAVAAAEAEARCSGARAQISDASAGKLRGALLCLVNRKRSANGLGKLRLDRKLQRAAGRHARDMARHDYFAHQRPGGPSLTERLNRARWKGSNWGETIAYGCGSSSSPRATLKGWMNSPPHRAILLSGTYKRGGLGLAAQAPCGEGAIWVLDVGRK